MDEEPVELHKLHPKSAFKEVLDKSIPFDEAKRRGIEIFEDLLSLRDSGIIGKGGKALDVGVGGGGGSLALKFLGWRVWGVDNKSSIGGEPAYFFNPRVASQLEEFFGGDIKNACFAQKVFDLVLFAQPVLGEKGISREEQKKSFLENLNVLRSLLSRDGVMIVGFKKSMKKEFAQLLEIVDGDSGWENLRERHLNHNWIVWRNGEEV